MKIIYRAEDGKEFEKKTDCFIVVQLSRQKSKTFIMN